MLFFMGRAVLPSPLVYWLALVAGFVLRLLHPVGCFIGYRSFAVEGFLLAGRDGRFGLILYDRGVLRFWAIATRIDAQALGARFPGFGVGGSLFASVWFLFFA